MDGYIWSILGNPIVAFALAGVFAVGGLVHWKCGGGFLLTAALWIALIGGGSSMAQQYREEINKKIDYIQNNTIDFDYMNKNFILLKQGTVIADGDSCDYRLFEDTKQCYYLLVKGKKEENEKPIVEIYRQNSIEGKNMIAKIQSGVLD